MAKIKRIKVRVLGTHPLLPLIERKLINKGSYLVGEDVTPDFYLVGAGPSLRSFSFKETSKKGPPALILSTDNVYTCLDSSLNIRPVSKMKEEDPLIIPSTLEFNTLQQTKSIYAEAYCKSVFKGKTMIVRPFGVYGPSCPTSIISVLSNQALCGKPLELFVPEQRKRSYLYEDDFLLCIDKLIEALLNGHSGLFNVGSEEVISITNLANSIYQLLNKAQETAPVTLKRQSYFIDFWKIPDITRVKAVTKWKPTISIRSGIWRNLGIVERKNI